MYPNVENVIVMPVTKRIEIIKGVQVFPISLMNFDYEGNGGKKAFPTNPKHNIMNPNKENMIVVLISNGK